jgi:hypothetical protein
MGSFFLVLRNGKAEDCAEGVHGLSPQPAAVGLNDRLSGDAELSGVQSTAIQRLCEKCQMIFAPKKRPSYLPEAGFSQGREDFSSLFGPF